MSTTSILASAFLVFFVFSLSNLLEISASLSIIITVAVLIHACLFLPRWLLTPALRKAKLKGKDFNYILTGLIGIIIPTLSVETNGSAESFVLAIVVASVLLAGLTLTFKASDILNSTLSSLNTTTIIQPKKLTNPKRWTSKVNYLNKITLATLSAISRAVIALNGSLSSLFPATLIVTFLTMTANFMVIKTVKGKEFRELLSVQREKYANSIKASLERYEPTTLLYHSGPVTHALKDAISTLKKADKKFYIIARERAVFNALKKTKTPRVILCVKLAEIEPFIKDTVEEIYYTNNRAKNVHVIRYYEFKHILMNSPENALERSPSYGMFTHRIVKTSPEVFRVETIEGDHHEYETKQCAVMSI